MARQSLGAGTEPASEESGDSCNAAAEIDCAPTSTRCGMLSAEENAEPTSRSQHQSSRADTRPQTIFRSATPSDENQERATQPSSCIDSTGRLTSTELSDDELRVLQETLLKCV